MPEKDPPPRRPKRAKPEDDPPPRGAKRAKPEEGAAPQRPKQAKSEGDRPAAARERAEPDPLAGTGAPLFSRSAPGALAPATVLRVVLIVMGAVLALLIVYFLRKPIGWMVIAGFIAIAVSGPVAILQRRLRRGLAIAVVYLGVILVPAAMLAVLVPPLVEQGGNLARNAPSYANDLNDFAQRNERLQELDDKYDLTARVQETAADLPGKVGDAAGTLADLGAGLVSSVFALVTILILSVFMVGAGPRWRAAFLRLHPPARADLLDRLFDRIGAAVGNYVLGALLQALIAGVTSYIVLLILGVPYPLALALVIFALDLIPLLGATIGAVLVGVVTVFQDFPTVTIVWVVWSVVYQQVENNVIQPRIQARQVQVEPFIVLASVLFGSSLFGVIGALFAIPAAASIQIAVREYLLYSGRLRPEEEEEREPPLAEGSAPATAG
ncbi:MAG: AI-2E family transporter [Solirubrobacteraceae bacterium]